MKETVPTSVRRASRDRAFTLVEILLVAALTLVVLLVVWRVFEFFFGISGKTGVTRLTGKSLVQREARLALRKLMHRIREASEILDAPGKTTTTLRFKDILNDEIRLRVDKNARLLLSERLHGGAFVPEKRPTGVKTETGQTIFPAFPIRVEGCKRASFTVVSPTCVIAYLTLVSGKIEDTIMLAVDLQNSAIRK